MNGREMRSTNNEKVETRKCAIGSNDGGSDDRH